MFLYDLINCVNIDDTILLDTTYPMKTEKFCYLLFHTYWISSCNRVSFCYRWNAETNWNVLFFSCGS